MKKTGLWLGILLAVVLILVAAVFISDGPKPMQILFEKPLTVPSGYTVIDVSSYGKTQGYYTWFCVQNQTGKIYDCTDGIVSDQYIFPDNYVFIGASSFGEINDNRTYYCRDKDNGQAYECIPTIISPEK